MNIIKALDPFNVTLKGGQPKADLRPYRRHQDDVVGVNPIKDGNIHRLETGVQVKVTMCKPAWITPRAASGRHAQHPRVRGSGTDSMRGGKTMSERFPAAISRGPRSRLALIQCVRLTVTFFLLRVALQHALERELATNNAFLVATVGVIVRASSSIRALSASARGTMAIGRR